MQCVSQLYKYKLNKYVIEYVTNQRGQCQAQILYCLRCWTNLTSTYIARVLIINSTTAQQVQIATLYTMLNEKRSV